MYTDLEFRNVGVLVVPFLGVCHCLEIILIAHFSIENRKKYEQPLRLVNCCLEIFLANHMFGVSWNAGEIIKNDNHAKICFKKALPDTLKCN